MFGALGIGLIMDKYGRRPSFILSIIVCTIGWLLQGISTNLNLIFLGQFLAGIIPGCMYIGQVYAAESIVINHTHLRSSFNVWSSIANSVGIIVTTVLGRLVPYQTVALIAAAMASTSLMSICVFIPESPHWLCQRGLIHQARLSERQLSIHQPILKDYKHTQENAKFDMRLTWQSLKNGLQKMKRKDVYKPLIILNVWFILVVFSGSSCVNAYQVSILNDYPVITDRLDSRWFGQDKSSLINSYDQSIVSAILTLVAIIFTSVLVTYTGIKALFILSAIGMAISMTGLGISLSIDDEYQATNFWKSTYTASIWMISFFDNLGLSIIPISVIGELFPHDAKGFASLPSLSYCGIGGIVIKLHPYFYTSLGYSLYYIYAFFCLLSIVFVTIFVPETVGKTQEDIGEYFAK